MIAVTFLAFLWSLVVLLFATIIFLTFLWGVWWLIKNIRKETVFRKIRWVLVVVCLLMVALFGWMTLSVPMIASAGPAVLTLIALIATWIVWPKRV